MYHYTGSGLSNIWLSNGYSEHETPYGPAVSITDVEGLHKAIGLEIVYQPLKRLAGEEVRFLRLEMDLSQRALATMLSLREITVRKWEQNGCPKGPAQILLRALYLLHISGNAQLKEIMERLRTLDCKTAVQMKLRFRDDPDQGWKRERLAA